MKELLPEVWRMVAKELHRSPPPAGAEANWNDDFQQQDLVSLQRVSKLYVIVSPILYRDPIVQNLGLLLQGIQQPRQITDAGEHHDRDSVPYHKSELLDFVITLHVIHASSRIAVELPYILPSEDEGISLETGVRTCSADRLGKADFAGWILARSLLDEIKSQSLQALRPSLRNIKSFSIGAWHDRRWALYADRLYDGLVDPIVYYREILTDLLQLMQSSKPVAVCTGTWANVGNLWKDHEPHISACPSLRVFHPRRDQEAFKFAWLHHHGPSRVFLLYSYQWNTGIRHNDNHFKPNTDDSHDVFEVYREYMQYVFDKSVKGQTEDGHYIIDNAILDEMSLEICIVPEVFDVGDIPNIPYLLDVAKRLKTAVEQYHEKLAEKEEYAKICLGKIKVYTAEALPACPCCGLREEFGADIYVHNWGSLA